MENHPARESVLYGTVIPLLLSIAGACINYALPVDIAFGVSMLAGNGLGVAAAMIAPRGIGVAGPLITMLPTVLLWHHPWALASPLLEGLAIAALMRRNHPERIILFEILYWPLWGAPLVLLQYYQLLGMNLDASFAAAAKQGVNAIFNSLVGVVLYYGIALSLRWRRLVTLRPGVREYLTVFLSFCVLVPILAVTFATARSRKLETIQLLREKTETVIAVASAEMANDPTAEGMARLRNSLTPAGYRVRAVGAAQISSAGGYAPGEADIWGESAEHVVLHRQGNSLIVGNAAEKNPMKRWTGAHLRMERMISGGIRIQIARPLRAEVLAIHSLFTRVFLFLFLWMGLAGMVAFLLGKIAVRPLERLRAAAMAIEHGAEAVNWPQSPVQELQELRDSLVLMTGSLKQRTMELEEAKRAAERLTRRSERYLSFMGHELKAPLAAIGSLLEVESGESAADRAVILDSVTKLLALINDLLDQARSAAGTLVLRREPFAPASEIQSVLEPFTIQARRRGLAFRIDIGDGLDRVVCGDVIRFRQIISNLVGNAIKYTPRGTISVHIDAREEKGRMVVHGSVADTGVGIDPAYIGEIWKPFTAVGTITASGISSHGLWLSIVRGIVDAMGGDISVISTPGSGSTFRFSLPFDVQGQQCDDIPDAAMTMPQLHGVMVLVADDDPIARMAVGTIFSAAGATVEEAENGTAALQMALVRSYAVIVLDAHMPGLSGTEVARRIRANATDKGSRAFVILSSADPSFSCENADAIAPKPVSIDAFARALARQIPY